MPDARTRSWGRLHGSGPPRIYILYVTLGTASSTGPSKTSRASAARLTAGSVHGGMWVSSRRTGAGAVGARFAAVEVQVGDLLLAVRERGLAEEQVGVRRVRPARR